MRPFELTPEELQQRLEEMVDVVHVDLASGFLLLPKGSGFVDYPEFQGAYEVLKRRTRGFEDFTSSTVTDALLEDSGVFVVVRSILGNDCARVG